MDILVAAHGLLRPLGYLDSNGAAINIALRILCFASTFFLLIPATFHTIFVADTFALRIATAMHLIIGVTNTSLYFAMLSQRSLIVSTLKELEQTIRERKRTKNHIFSSESTTKDKRK